MSNTHRMILLLITVIADMIFTFHLLILAVVFGCRFMFDMLINGLPLPNLSLVINSNELFQTIKSISLAIYGRCFLTVPGCCINI